MVGFTVFISERFIEGRTFASMGVIGIDRSFKVAPLRCFADTSRIHSQSIITLASSERRKPV